MLAGLLCFLLVFVEITNTPLRIDIVRVAGIFLHLFPEAAHMNIHSTEIPWILISPYKIQKLFPAVYFIRSLHQKLHQIKLLGSQSDLPALDKQTAAFRFFQRRNI